MAAFDPWLVCYVTIFVAYISKEIRVGATVCMAAADFETFCTGLGGKLSAAGDGQCFYLPTASVSGWEAAWDECAKNNGLPFTFQSAPELTTVGSLTGAGPYYTAMKTMSPNPPKAKTDFAWYLTKTFYLPGLTPNATKMAPMFTDPALMKENCVVLYNGAFETRPCAGPMQVICQVPNELQVFHLWTGKCLDPNFSADIEMGATVEDCANLCAKTAWCKSYVPKESSVVLCALLQWDDNDNPEAHFAADGSCLTYVRKNT